MKKVITFLVLLGIFGGFCLWALGAFSEKALPKDQRAWRKRYPLQLNQVPDENLWVRTYGEVGSDEAIGIVPATDGTYIVAGRIPYPGSNYYNKAMVLKLHPDGSVVWKYKYDVSNNTFLTRIIPAKEGGCFLVGSMDYSAATWILKLSSNGSVEWQRWYSRDWGSRGHAIDYTSDDGLIISGFSWELGQEFADFYALKISAFGDFEWQYIYPGPDEEADDDNLTRFSTIKQVNDGGYLLVGDTRSFGAGWTDIWVLKLRSDGSIEWQNTYGGIESEWMFLGNTLCETPDGKYVVGCSTLSFGVGYYQAFWIFVLNPDGSIEHQRTFKGDAGDLLQSIYIDDNGYLMAVGGTQSFGVQNTDLWVLKLTRNLDIIWQFAYGGEFNEEARSVFQTEKGDYVVAGYTGSYGMGDKDFLVMKISEDGYLTSNCKLTMTSTDAVVENTDAAPSSTQIVARGISSFISTPSTSPIDIDAKTNVICWNLNQPPIDLSVTVDINRTLFAGELIITVSWNPNPLNSEFSINEYRAYRKYADEGNDAYEFLGSVPAGTFQFQDFARDFQVKFFYIVISVDSNGNESPWSEPVGN